MKIFPKQKRMQKLHWKHPQPIGIFDWEFSLQQIEMWELFWSNGIKFSSYHNTEKLCFSSLVKFEWCFWHFTFSRSLLFVCICVCVCALISLSISRVPSLSHTCVQVSIKRIQLTSTTHRHSENINHIQTSHRTVKVQPYECVHTSCEMVYVRTYQTVSYEWQRRVCGYVGAYVFVPVSVWVNECS